MQVDSDRQWTKAERGCGNLDLPRELDRIISFDAHTILSVPPLHEKALKLKRSGNEVYCTNSLILLINNMLCSGLSCQKVLIQKPF